MKVPTQTRANNVAVVTCGDKVPFRLTKITFKNTGDSPIKISLTSHKGCSVKRGAGVGFSSWSSATVYSGNSCNIWIVTWLGNVGNVKFKVVSSFGSGEAYSYNVTSNDGSTIARVL